MKLIECKQGTSSWFQLRRGVPTASRFSKIITPRTGKLSTQADGLIAELIAERVMPYTPEDVEKFTSRDMEHGLNCEGEARNWYEANHDCEIEQVGFCLTDCERFGCSPDGLVGAEGLVQIKCPALKTQIGYLLSEAPLAEYLPQCHGELLVTGRKWLDLISYCFWQPALSIEIRIEPNEYTEQLRQALEQFWPRYQEALAKIRALLPEQPEELKATA